MLLHNTCKCDNKYLTYGVCFLNLPCFSIVAHIPPADIENRLSTMLSHNRSSAAVDFSPTGDYRRGETSR